MAKFNTSFARTNAIKARKKRLQEVASPENLDKAITEFVTRVLATTATLTKEAMVGREVKEEWTIVRPTVEASIAEALLTALGGRLPLQLKDGATKERIRLVTSPKAMRKTWTGVLTANHVEKYGERTCPKCELRLAIGDTVTVPAGEEVAYHRKCKPETKVPQPGAVRVFDVTRKHLERRPDGACLTCMVRFKLDDSVAWRIGWDGMLHEACWSELGKPEALK